MGSDGEYSAYYFSFGSDGIPIKEGVFQVGSSGIPVYIVGSSDISSDITQVNTYLDSINDFCFANAFCLSLLVGLIISVLLCMGLHR